MTPREKRALPEDVDSFVAHTPNKKARKAIMEAGVDVEKLAQNLVDVKAGLLSFEEVFCGCLNAVSLGLGGSLIISLNRVKEPADSHTFRSFYGLDVADVFTFLGIEFGKDLCSRPPPSRVEPSAHLLEELRRFRVSTVDTVFTVFLYLSLIF